MSDITDADYTHAKRVCKHLGEYRDLYIQNDTFLLADAFENFRNACLEIYELNPARFFTLPGLAWKGALKKTKAKFDLSTNIDMLLMVEKSIRGRICQAIHQYAKANSKYMKVMIKIKNCPILSTGM